MTSIVTSNASATFTRPADTTAYASGDLVANSTTAGSVAAMSLSISGYTGGMQVRRVKLAKSSVGTSNAQFRVHLFKVAPTTVTNGDNGAFSVSGVADYVGACDVTMGQAFTDGAAGHGVPNTGSDITAQLTSGSTLFALLEARAAYVPVSAETFTLSLEDVSYG